MPTKKEPKEVKPTKPKKEEAPKAMLSIDEIKNLISASAPKPKPKRKTGEQTDEQREKMLSRLALMRAKANENRALRSKTMTDELKTINTLEHGTSLEIRKINEKDSDSLFEKKYNSRFEKLDESVSEIKSHLTEMREAKKAKAEAKIREAEEKKKNEPSEPSKPSEPIYQKSNQDLSNTQSQSQDLGNPERKTQNLGNPERKSISNTTTQPQNNKLPDFKKMFKRQY
jgi:hypothetical protein